MSSIKKLFTKVSKSISSLLRYTPEKTPILDFQLPLEEQQPPINEVDPPANSVYETASFYMAKRDSKLNNTNSVYPTTQLKFDTSNKKLSRNEYKNLPEHNFSFLKNKKVNPVMKMVQYITNDKFNNNYEDSVDMSNVSMKTSNSAFKVIGGSLRGSILNEKRRIISFNDFSSNSLLGKKGQRERSFKTDDNDISMNSSYYDSNSIAKRMINKSVILSSKSLSDIALEVERKRKMNEESLQKLRENSISKRREQDYEERRKILEKYYNEKINKQKKSISVYNLFDDKNDNSLFDNLSFSHNERIMIKGKEKKENPLKINKYNEITITGTETKKTTDSTNEQKNTSIFKFSNLNNKGEEKKEDIFLYGKAKKEEENNTTSIFGNKDNINLSANSNTSLFGNTTKPGIFDNSSKESKPSLFDNSNKDSKPSLFENSKETKPSIFDNSSQETKTGLFDNSSKESKPSLFDNTNKGVSAPSLFGKNDTKISFNIGGDKKEEKKEDDKKKDEPSLFGIPKENTVEMKTSTLENTQTSKSLFGFSNNNNPDKKEEEKPKEENKKEPAKSIFGAPLSNSSSLFGGEIKEPSKSLFNKKVGEKKEDKPIIELKEIVEEKNEEESSQSIIKPPESEKKPISFDPPSSGSLLTANNPFVSAASSTQLPTTSLFSAPKEEAKSSTSIFNSQPSSLFNSSNQPSTLFGQPQLNPINTNNDDMQLSPVESPRKLETPGTNLFGTNSNNAPSGSLFTSNNNNSLFGNSSSSNNSLFASNNTISTPLFGATQTIGGATTGNTLFPNIQNSNSLGVPQTNLFTNPTFQIGTSKPVFNMGKK